MKGLGAKPESAAALVTRRATLKTGNIFDEDSYGYSKASIISDEENSDTLQRVQLRREVTNQGRVVWLTSDRQTTLLEAATKDEANAALEKLYADPRFDLTPED